MKEIFTFSFLLFILTSVNQAFGAAVGPNLLIILADDLGRNDIGYYGNTETSTPNIDKLFQEGIVLERLYTDSTCRPTRAALMTGLHPARLGYATDGYGISADIETLPRIMKANGYLTQHIGKWHLGYINDAARPNGLGYDFFFGFLDQGFLRGPQSKDLVYVRPPTYLDPWLQVNNDAPNQYQGHLEDILAQEAVNKIQKAPAKPWMMNLWFYAPHAPIEPHSRYLGPQPSEKERYYALVKQLDDNVGKVMQALKQSGQEENTIVVFLSDNGGTNHEADNNAPYYGAKVSFLEGGVRVPGVIRWPDKKFSGRRHQGIVHHVDLVPTLLSALSLQKPRNSDGHDRWNNILNEDQHLNQSMLNGPYFWEREMPWGYSFGALTTDGKWRYSYEIDRQQTPEWLSQVDNIETANINVATDPATSNLRNTLNNSYHEWHQQIRTLQLNREPLPSGVLKFTGDDFQRTPGTARLSVGIGLRADEQLPKVATIIAEQPDIWKLTVEKGLIKFKWGKLELDGTLFSSKQCQSVIISTFAALPGILSDSKLSMARMYINGVKVNEKLINETQLPQSFPPTYVGGNASGQNSAPILLDSIKIRNDFLYDTNDGGNPSAKIFSRDLCPH